MAHYEIMKRAVEEIEKGTSFAIVTVTRAQGSTPRGDGTQMIVFEDGSIDGTVGGGTVENKVIQESVKAIKKGISKYLELPLGSDELGMVCGGDMEVFIDVYKKKVKLLVIGGGHVGNAIYNLAKHLNFDIVMFEDREEFLTKERFPEAKELILGDFGETLANYDLEDTYILINSRGHDLDQRALETVAESKAKYIGMMGSKRKVLAIMRNLKEKGLNEETLAKVYSPVGLQICDETPEELAFSALAEILLIKNEGKLQHYKDTLN